MTYQSWFTNNAKADIKELRGHIVQNWSKQVWATAFDQIRHAVSMIEDQPYAGAVCQDLAALGITDYRQIPTSRNRIVYEVDLAGKRIIIHVICDQKRDLLTLLMRRFVDISIH